MLSLFSGIGGIDLAAQWAGIETVAFVEINPFCQKVLRKHWPGVKIYDDVRGLTGETLRKDGIGSIDIMAGGYPCQPFSYAGERKGEEDDRHLWPYLFEIISDVRPRWFVGENVAGHVTLGLDDVLSDLESIQYTTQPFIIPACAIGAIHRRDRVFMVTHSNSIGLSRWENSTSSIKSRQKSNEQLPRLLQTSIRMGISPPEFYGGVNGIPNRVDRSRALGNAVDPYQIYPIFKAIMDIEACSEVV